MIRLLGLAIGRSLTSSTNLLDDDISELPVLERLDYLEQERMVHLPDKDGASLES